MTVITADDDIYTGGAGADVFIFTKYNGQDTITDFDAGAGAGDVIDLSAWGIVDMAGLQAIADDPGGVGNTVLTLNDAASITLEGVLFADLATDDFMFA